MSGPLGLASLYPGLSLGEQNQFLPQWLLLLCLQRRQTSFLTDSFFFNRKNAFSLILPYCRPFCVSKPYPGPMHAPP